METFVTSVKEKYCGDLTTCDMWLYPHQRPSCLVPLQLAVTEHGGQHDNVIAHCNLFKGKHETERIKRVLIEGGAGMGKTSFCVSISQKWAGGELFDEYKLLLRLPLCQKVVASASSLSKLLQAVGGTTCCSSELTVSHIIENDGQGLLIVADGWDKLDHSIRQEGSFLYKLLFGNLLHHASVIVTARKSACAPLHKGTRCVQLLGFKKSSINDYVHFMENQVDEELLKEIEHNPLLKSVCSVPLVCSTVCTLWHMLGVKFPSSMTELCNKMIFSIVQHNLLTTESYRDTPSLTGVDQLPDSLKDAWWYMCQIAFVSIVHESEKSFPELHSFISRIDAFGLMEYVHKEQYVSFQFLLPVFREYLAAQHIISKSSDKQIINNLLHEIKSKQLTAFWRFFFDFRMNGAIRSRDVEFFQSTLQILSSELNASLRCTLCFCAFEAKNKAFDKEVLKVLSVRRQNSTVIVCFGEPHTTLDCDAVIYVVDKVHNLDCDGVEINFNGCKLEDKQIKELAEILSRQTDAVQVKGLDLSQNNLSDEIVAHLFNSAKASFRSVEKLSLCNNEISEKGMSALISALSGSSSSSITRMDLSCNPLSIDGLELLQGAVTAGTLAKLEVLLLRRSLTTDANTNLQFLISFVEKLSTHCKHLWQLDLSSNDLGDPKSSAIDDVTTKLLQLNKNFDFHLNRKYNIKDKFVTIMEESISQGETIDHTILHCVIVGPGRSGKNSLMSRLIGESADSISPSTGVLESVIKVEVMKLCKVGSAEADLIWRRLKYSEEALELMMRTTKNHAFSYYDTDGTNMPTNKERSNVQQSVSSEEIIDGLSQSLPTGHLPPTIRILKGATKHVGCNSCIIKPSHSAHESSVKYEGPSDMIKKAIELRGMEGVCDHLDSSWSIYLTNTGGQTEFQELLPFLVCGPSMFIITFPLSQDLYKHYDETFQFPDDSVGSRRPTKSPSILMDEILHTLATIAALDSTEPQVDEQLKPFIPTHKKLKPKVIFVGTHKDKLSNLSEIQKIDKQIQSKVKPTFLYSKGSIEFAVPGKQLIFAVNNFDSGDADFKKIRLTIQRIVERSGEFTIECPSPWLVFSLVLRAKYMSHQVLSYEDCYIIAQLCGISDREELNVALSFIHYRLGLIRYFCVDGLNAHVVIDPQILFKIITELMIDTFTEDHAEEFEIENFQKRGIFSMTAIERIVRKKCKCNSSDMVTHKLDLKWLLKLLDHLQITTSFKDDEGEQKYFFPALLHHAPEQQLSQYPLVPELPPPLLIAFNTGFCPRGIAGVITKYLMTNEVKPWKLRKSRIHKNQVSFGVGVCDVVVKILPTHLHVYIDPESVQSTDRREVAQTCMEASSRLQQAMKSVIGNYYKCSYYFGFYCTRKKCNSNHPAKIEFKGGDIMLCCERTDRDSYLPDSYKTWFQQGGYFNPRLDLVIDEEHNGVDLHLGKIADFMENWKCRIAEELGLTSADIANIEYAHSKDLNLQKREALKRWKQKLGSVATYNNLCKAFERAGYINYADFTRALVVHHSSHVQEPFKTSCHFPIVRKPVYPESDATTTFVTKSGTLFKQSGSQNHQVCEQEETIKTKRVLVQELVGDSLSQSGKDECPSRHVGEDSAMKELYEELPGDQVGGYREDFYEDLPSNTHLSAEEITSPPLSSPSGPSAHSHRTPLSTISSTMSLSSSHIKAGSSAKMLQPPPKVEENEQYESQETTDQSVQTNLVEQRESSKGLENYDSETVTVSGKNVSPLQKTSKVEGVEEINHWFDIVELSEDCTLGKICEKHGRSVADDLSDGRIYFTSTEPMHVTIRNIMAIDNYDDYNQRLYKLYTERLPETHRTARWKDIYYQARGDLVLKAGSKVLFYNEALELVHTFTIWRTISTDSEVDILHFVRKKLEKQDLPLEGIYRRCDSDNLQHQDPELRFMAVDMKGKIYSSLCKSGRKYVINTTSYKWMAVFIEVKADYKVEVGTLVLYCPKKFQ